MKNSKFKKIDREKSSAKSRVLKMSRRNVEKAKASGKYILCLVIAILFWGITPVVFKILLKVSKGINALNTSFFLTSVTAIVLFPFGLRKKIEKRKKGVLRKKPLKEFIFQCLVLSITGGVFSIYFFYKAVAELPAAIAMIINYTWPLLIIIFSYALLKEKIGKLELAGIISSFLGVVFISGIINGKSNIPLLAVCYALLGALGWSLYSVMLKKFNFDVEENFWIIMGLAALIFLLFSPSIKSLSSLLYLILFAFLTTTIPYTLWSVASTKLESSKLGSIPYLTPVITIITSYIFLGERMNATEILGSALIFLGIVTVIFAQRKRGK